MQDLTIENTQLQRKIRHFMIYTFLVYFRFNQAILILFFAAVSGSFTLGLSLFSIKAVASALFEVPTGIYSDYIGRKKTLILAVCVQILSTIVFGISWNFWSLAFGSILFGLARAFFSGTTEAYLYDTLLEVHQEKEYANFHGIWGATLQGSLGIAALIGGFIGAYSLRLVILLGIIPLLGALVLTLRFQEPQVHDLKRSGNLFTHCMKAGTLFVKNIRLRYMSISSIISYGVGEAYHQMLPAFYDFLWPRWAIGIARSIEHLLAVLGFYYAGRIIKRFESLRVLLLSNLIGRGIGFLSAGIANVISPALLSLNSITYGIGHTARAEFLHKEFSSSARATMGSLNQLAGSLFFALCSVLLGFVVDTYGIIIAVVVAEMGLLSISVFYLLLIHFEKRTQSIKSALE